MSKIKLVAILLLIATIAWCGTLVYATTQVPTRLHLGPGDKFLVATEVRPTENQNEWQQIETNITIEAEYIGELEEPLDIYVKTAIENTNYFVIIPENAIFPVERRSVYKFKDSYYYFYGGISTFYADAIDPEMLKTVSETLFNLGIAGIPLFGLWAGTGIYHIKQKKTSPTTDEEEK